MQVPWPGADTSVSAPPSASMRKRMPSSPKAEPGRWRVSKPVPSSRTDSITQPPTPARLIQTWLAPAYLETLVMDSCTMR